MKNCWDVLYVNLGLLCLRQVSQARIKYYSPQFTVGCNYLYLPEIPGLGAKSLNYVVWSEHTLSFHQPAHDDVIKWKHFPRYWPFVRGINRSPLNSPHKGQWRRALMFSLNYAWINGWVNTDEYGDLRRNQAHYDVTLMIWLGNGCYWFWRPMI